MFKYIEEHFVVFFSIFLTYFIITFPLLTITLPLATTQIYIVNDIFGKTFETVVDYKLFLLDKYEEGFRYGRYSISK